VCFFIHRYFYGIFLLMFKTVKTIQRFDLLSKVWLNEYRDNLDAWFDELFFSWRISFNIMVSFCIFLSRIVIMVWSIYLNANEITMNIKMMDNSFYRSVVQRLQP
jgi:hypothetical protein